MQKKLELWAEILFRQVKVLPRADQNDNLDPEKWTLVVVEQGIGDQVLFLSVMEEAIQEFKNIFFIIEARMKTIIERSFPGLQVGFQDFLNPGNKIHYKKMVIFLWEVYLVDIVKVLKVLQIIKSPFFKLMETYTSNTNNN